MQPPTIRYTPSKPLSNCVEQLWYQGSHASRPPMERALPDGSVELVLNLENETIEMFEGESFDRRATYRDAVLCGPHSKPFVIGSSAADRVVGAHFRPGGIQRFVECPVGDLEDRHLSLEDLWGTEAARIRSDVGAADDPWEVLRRLEAWLLARMRHSRGSERVVQFALDELQGSYGNTPVSEIVDTTGMSHRAFIEVFRQAVGMTPKTISRLQRFQLALERVYTGSCTSWSDLAAACGYYDQAHFVHEFRAFAGLRPTEYLAYLGHHPNHVPVPL